MTIKAYLSFIISLCLLAITITPAFATLPNEAVFNWVEYKFADLFPKSQTVKSELTHDGVHYDLRSWAGAWGTRYLGITDDGEIIGLGDFTDGELLSFGYIDDWEEAVVADNDDVFSNLNPNTYVVVSDTPDYSPWNLSHNQKYGCFTMMPVWQFIEGMDGKNHAFFFPTMFFTADSIPGMDFVENEPDKFTLTQHVLPNIEVARDYIEMDTDRTDIKRFAIASTGAEIENVEPENWNNGDVWVATDYGNGFEFETINDFKAFNHGVAASDIDNDGYDELVVNNMGAKPSIYDQDALHAYDQVSDGVFEQYYPFDLQSITIAPDANQRSLESTGSVAFIDLNNDGVDELVQGAGGGFEQWPTTRWGAIRIWQVIDGQLVEAFNAPRDGLFDVATYNYTASGLFPFDYNNDGLVDILVAMEAWWGSGLEIYRNDGNLQFTRVTDEVLPDHIFNSDLIASKEMSVADVNNDGLDDIVLHPASWSWDVNEQTPTAEGTAVYTTWFWEDYNDNDLIPWNMGAAIYLNNGTTFIRQINNPAYTVNIKKSDYPEYLRLMDTKDGVTRFFGVSKINHTPVVLKVEAE